MGNPAGVPAERGHHARLYPPPGLEPRHRKDRPRGRRADRHVNAHSDAALGPRFLTFLVIDILPVPISSPGMVFHCPN